MILLTENNNFLYTYIYAYICMRIKYKSTFRIITIDFIIIANEEHAIFFC